MEISFQDKAAKDVKDFFQKRYPKQKISCHYDALKERYSYYLDDKPFYSINRFQIDDFRNKICITVKESFIYRLRAKTLSSNKDLTGEIFIDSCLIDHRKHRDYNPNVVEIMRNALRYPLVVDPKKVVEDYTNWYCNARKKDLEAKQTLVKTIDGITYQISGDNMDFLMESAVRVKRIVDLIDPNLRKYMGTIKLMDYRNPYDPYWDIKYPSDGTPFYSSATGGNKLINLYSLTLEGIKRSKPKEYLDVFYHEIGHSIDKQIEGAYISNSVGWINAVLEDRFINGDTSVTS